MRTIAKKLAREIQKAKRSQVVDLGEVRRVRDELRSDSLDGLRATSALILQRYKLVAMSAQSLLGSTTLEKLRRKIEEADEYYMPGMPPQSPVLDSMFMTWMLCDLTVGPQSETLTSLLAELSPVLGFPRELVQEARALAASRLGIYRVLAVNDERVTLFDLIERRERVAHQVDDWAVEGQLWLARLVKAPEDSECQYHLPFTPYVLLAPERDWEGYLERVSSARDIDTLCAHFKHPKTPVYWFDFILDGYAGVEEIVVRLTGVPDRPETLPHSLDNKDGEFEDDVFEQSESLPIATLRSRLWALAQNSGMSGQSDAALDKLMEPLGGLERLSKYGSDLAKAFQIYGFLNDADRTVLEEFESSSRAQALSVAEARELRALKSGWFSVFEIRLVRIDEGFELFDTWRRKLIFVHEKSGTRGASTGDVLAAQLSSHDDGTFTLEGALAHVPRLWAASFVEKMREFRDDATRQFPRLGWKKRAGLLMLHTIVCYEAMAQSPPLPRLANLEGHELVWCEAHYEVVDKRRVLACLDDLAERVGDEWKASSDKAVEAEFSLKESRLILRCNSRERLERWKGRLNQALGGAARHKADSFTDGQAAMKGARARPGASSGPPQALPPELQQAVAEHLRGMMRSWVDEPIPLLGNKTPREAVRSQRGRDQVTELLLNQEKAFASNPQFAPVDLTAIWNELGLRHPDR